MASNKDSNSSKTAHVMNLLSKSRGPAPAPEADPAPKASEAPQAEVQAPVLAEPAPKAAPVAPILSSLNADAAVSSQIKDALENELDAELAELTEEDALAPPPAQEPEAEPEVVVLKAPAEPAPSADELMGVPQPEEPAGKPAAPASAEELAPEVLEEPAKPEYESPIYTNVMQTLVEEKAEKYMRMFGLCCCDMCQVDVKAYALNHLPPKYVVMATHERIPKLTVYESKFSSDITAQLIQACKVVMAHPHHTR